MVVGRSSKSFWHCLMVFSIHNIKKTIRYAELLPMYLKISSRYTLAIWECGNSSKPRSLWRKWQDVRITIREDSEWRFTIKQGEYEDEKRCSIYFKPFGLNVSRLFK